MFELPAANRGLISESGPDMTNTTKPKRKTRAELEREVLELKAQLAHTYHFAAREISKAGQNHLMGSGVLLQMTAIGGKEIVVPIMIRDGLSTQTIEAISADIQRSYDQAVAFKP